MRNAEVRPERCELSKIVCFEKNINSFQRNAPFYMFERALNTSI